QPAPGSVGSTTGGDGNGIGNLAMYGGLLGLLVLMLILYLLWRDKRDRADGQLTGLTA
ncbi:MAG: hypothetical protein H0V92_06375, partial [Pseudonocardiales bacterium]|nr:hypothetical protein [Pseudonocardiales bacterium]